MSSSLITNAGVGRLQRVTSLLTRGREPKRDRGASIFHTDRSSPISGFICLWASDTHICQICAVHQPLSGVDASDRAHCIFPPEAEVGYGQIFFNLTVRPEFLPRRALCIALLAASNTDADVSLVTVLAKQRLCSQSPSETF